MTTLMAFSVKRCSRARRHRTHHRQSPCVASRVAPRRGAVRYNPLTTITRARAYGDRTHLKHRLDDQSL
eukprot:CAMPEP_0174579314 /NCGR_PEP_ID=MMETSP0929-20130131/1505_1 /TAXON_ID=548131 ORGANISM="Ostreococcus mediterraneus, Strain clade-D-RCC2572" /NCGR_SAMPLE_ID=MMETSP0929 /ASSEMBLY_ACC=CAM_ASM_000573 /LENGTH=68 /DNA_ID=CAMNT_0015760647 /DNA_START=6 /DNA_END=209 /DNA_ORIENTATION=-